MTPIEDLRSRIEAEASGDGTKFLAALETATGEAQKVLADNGYGELESIATRVAALDLQMQAAIDLKQYKDFAPLGAALERAKRGLPPLTVTEKKSKSATVEPRKPKVTKAVKTVLEDSEGAPKEPGTLATQGELSDASVQTSAT